ncbi:TetR/AcrR family transcriptional regulator [Ekhidna sp.]|uniref:TetR/AcrR family transcriptional regulator n=1 Tax=Ekhidna sp. TaxID=2608089 RepID=UPI003C7CA436
MAKKQTNFDLKRLFQYMPKSITFDREKVVENVMELFWKKGYNGTSMQDLVNVTGLNRSSFYNSFGDKFSLFEEALKQYQQRQNEMLQESFAGAKSPKQAIISLFKGISDDIRSGNQKGCMLTSCASEMSDDPKIRDFLIDNMDRVVDAFNTLIQQAQEKGEISYSKESRTLALYLFSCLQGLRITSKIEPNLEAVTDEIISVL